uniref:Phosphoglycerate kinase n=1 Tax=Sterkiella nova TaxID=200597 RepID=PGK_STENO|nr:RecName: Full=Phosphoglycerate kinase [Sterkiella nova]AAB58240.1 phosphoglycerate kinase [Sterkiella nova]
MLSKKLAIDHIPHLIKGKRVLMRVDFNVPIKEGKIKDLTRIQGALPSINYCLENGAESVVLMSHLGRPDGQRVEKHSLKPVLPAIEDLLKKKVQFLDDCVGSEVERECKSASKGKVILLENLRFHLAEEGKGVINGEKVKATKEDIAAFRKSLTSLGELYVNDGFGTAHRAHSSMVGVNVDTRAAGFLLKKELQYFSKILETPERPLTVVMGGAKVADKIQLIMKLLELADELIIGGGMAFTFNKVLDGSNIGKSLFDQEGAKIVPDIIKKAKERGVKIHLPVDAVAADKFEESAATQLVDLKTGAIPDGWMGLDIGPKTIEQNSRVILRAKTVFWNGPQGVFEMAPFSKGSLSMLDDIIKATQTGATSVAGGGDTVSLLGKVKGTTDKFSHVSTGGGASLELLQGKQLPGVVALSDRQ